MSEEIQPVRGMNDVLPAEIGAWQHFERGDARSCSRSYGYEEIRVPLVEHTELFKRAIGEYTDVVEKEMYTFTDRGGESLTLRPEATAGIVRALDLQRHAARRSATSSGARARCSATSDRRRAATGSSTRSTSRRSASRARRRRGADRADARGCGSGSASRA